MGHRTALGLVALAATVGFARPAAAQAPSGGATTYRLTPRIVNGTLTSQYPTTGALLDSSNFSTARMICSGTLIGCQTFLTAGHCVAGNLNPASYSVFLQHAGFFRVSGIDLNPNFNFPVGDVAVVHLASAVNGIAPTRINTDAAPPDGTAGSIAGFGRSGGGASNLDYGLKRVGAVSTASCSSGVSNSTSICWDFSNPLGPPGTDSNTCNGDSGGPLFVDLGSGVTVAGITSGGDSATCLPTDHSYDANVYFYRSYIEMQAGTDLSHTSCGDLPQIGNVGSTVSGFSGQLSSVVPESTRNFTVPPGTSVLRVAMNAIDDGSSDFNLYVKAGSPPTSAAYDCKQTGTNQYAFCEFDAPVAGTWYALLSRVAGGGTYQLTVSQFGTQCSIPGNDGQPCDDHNICTADDVCQNGTCIGSAVSDGTSCDDANPCTILDACNGGLCIGTEAPRTDCHDPAVPQQGTLRLEENLGRPQALIWGWTHGSLTPASEFGNPLLSTAYDLCMYDTTGDTPHVALHKHIAAAGMCGRRGCWKSTRQGYRFRDRSSGGINTVILKPGTRGKAKIVVKGKSDTLGLPALPLSQQNTVTVQLTNGAHCWEGHYSTNTGNSATRFRARAD